MNVLRTTFPKSKKDLRKLLKQYDFPKPSTVNNRHLVFVLNDDQNASNYLESRWYDFELYRLAEFTFAINEYSADRLDPMLNEQRNRFSIVNIKSVSQCRKIFINDANALAKYDQFVYLTRPLPTNNVLSEHELQSVINQLLDKILCFNFAAQPLTYDEQHFMRSLASETRSNG